MQYHILCVSQNSGLVSPCEQLNRWWKMNRLLIISLYGGLWFVSSEQPSTLMLKSWTLKIEIPHTFKLNRSVPSLLTMVFSCHENTRKPLISTTMYEIHYIIGRTMTGSLSWWRCYSKVLNSCPKKNIMKNVLW